MKSLFGYWPYLAVLALGFGIAYLLFGVGPADNGALKAAQRREQSAQKLADQYKQEAEAWHRKFVADTTGDAALKTSIAASAKKAADFRAVTHPIVRKPNAYANPNATVAARTAAVRAADSVLALLPRP